MISIDASTQTYNTRFIGRICFVAAGGSTLVDWLRGTVVCGLLLIAQQLVYIRSI